jgi:hypothetical protein
MKKILLFCTLLAFLVFACEGKSLSPKEKSEVPPAPKVMVEKEKGEREEPLPLEVKIKLKRDGKDNYSWEISGSDVNQILKVDEKLRKQLGGEPTR